MRASFSLLAAWLLVVGCSRKPPPPSSTTAPSNAATTAETVVVPPPVGDAASPALGPCADPFPPARLDALASDPKALRPWGATAVDEANKIAKELPWNGKGGDPDRLAIATGVPLPVAYADFLRRFDGADVMGKGGRIELWRTQDGSELATDDARPFRNTAERRFLSIGTDGADWELFIDIDGWFGRGACAVLFADETSDDVYFLAPSFVKAIDAVVNGPGKFYDVERLDHARPPK